MANLNINNYSNHLELFGLSSTEIEKQLLTFELTFFETHNQIAEWEIRFPIFLDSFYKFIYNRHVLPSQFEFYEYYKAQNSDWLSSKTERLTEEVLIGLKARLYRTYPSLVRDFHFAKLASEELTDCTIIYNKNLDVIEGIDLLIIVKRKNIAINLFTKTRRADIGRKKKETRHTQYDNISYVELPVDFNGSVVKGDFFLYGTRELNQLNELIVKSIVNPDGYFKKRI